MRYALLAVLFATPLLCDLPPEVSFAGGSVVPVQLWPGDVAQIYEPNVPTGNGTYNHEPTAATALTNAGVWGHDEGPSIALADGRVLWYWGDSVTAYEQTGVAACGIGSGNWCAYQLQTCTSNGSTQSCLGADTVSYAPAGGVAAGKLYKCTNISDWDNALIAGTGFTPDYTNCSQMQYITTHGGDGIPKAGFTFEDSSLDSTHPLATGEDLLLGHTATGLFAVPDSVDSAKERLYVNYQVKSQVNAGFNFRTESILLRSSNYTGDITGSVMPKLGRYYTFSQPPIIPQGTVRIDNTTNTVTSCSGSKFGTRAQGWDKSYYWQALLIEDPAGNPATYTVTGVSSDTALTIDRAVPNDPVNDCSDSLNFDMIPNQDHDTGKFIFVAPELLDTSVVQGFGSGAMPWLPANTKALCFWGSSFYYRNSNVYLACAQGDDATMSASSAAYYPGFGLSVLHYFTGFDVSGNPVWEDVAGGTVPAEVDAVPLLTSWTHQGSNPGAPCIAEQSVRWIPALKRFLMTYGSFNCGGLWYRTATAPWGPWSAEVQFFPNSPSAGWQQRLIYFDKTDNPYDFNTRPLVAILDPSSGQPINGNGSTTDPFGKVGNPYGAYQYPGSTSHENTDGSGTVTVLMNMSGFNPYVTWQLAAKFYKTTGAALSGTVKITPLTKISH